MKPEYSPSTPAAIVPARPWLGAVARRMPPSSRALVRALAFGLAVGPHTAASADGTRWPELQHPRGALVETVGREIRLDRVPMRLTRVLVTAPPEVVAEHYRGALGADSAHARTGTSQVLAHARGDFFITVTLTPLADGGSEALVSIADSRAAREASDRPLGFALPAGSELLSDMESIDGRTASRQLVLTNTHSLGTNLSRLSAGLAHRGLRPEGPPLAETDDSLARHFRGRGGEARLVLVRRDGITSAVLTLLSPHP